jgi:nucleotide-binding universal stress UspA family protein
MYDTIVVGVDGSDEATAALDHAVELAKAVGATVHVLAVIETQANPLKFSVEEVAELDQTATELLEKLVPRADQIEIESEIRRGNPTEMLQSYGAEVDADLLVVGQQGAGGIEATVLGSTTDRLARVSDRPITIVPANEQSET